MKIECTLGRAVELTVAGDNVSFVRDDEGRFVADVYNARVIKCLLSVAHYRELGTGEPVVVPVVQTVVQLADDDQDLDHEQDQDLGQDLDGDLDQDLEQDDNSGNPNANPDTADDKSGDQSVNSDAASVNQTPPAPTPPATPTTPPVPPVDPASMPGIVPPIEAIAGIGPAIKSKLATVGITTVAHVAALTSEQIAELDAKLDLSGRFERYGWIEQARQLLQPQVSE
ncbi:hypothetical protein [Aminobacter sp. MDW-2]|uniref:hypothetical protein n=1 Tax=Aminobacter sp. MDW-2 TaxID=2666139 RepID=UPI0012AEEC80|nr:hypothetical protein [Aminobacter sp. MDW-2]MRX32811.1 hypothetical protein [Aminobacter sp. MDW-2]QNH34530.1 hypothetical protein H5P29_00820 [Aminobacter sp. MDW-2]